MVKFRTRKHYGGNDWVGQLLALYVTNRTYRLFIFWGSPDWRHKPYPVELQIRKTGKKSLIWPKRKKQ